MDRLKRREFIALISSAAVWRFAARAQQPERMRRLGALTGKPTSRPRARAALFTKEARVAGLERPPRGRGDPEIIRRQAAELVALAPDVILATGGPALEQMLHPSHDNLSDDANRPKWGIPRYASDKKTAYSIRTEVAGITRKLRRGAMASEVWILCRRTFKAMQPYVAANLVAVFIAGLGSEAAAPKNAPKDLTACFKSEGDAAIAACTDAITSGKYKNADLATAHVVRGNAYFIKGDYNSAARDYDEAIQLNPNNAVAFYNKGNLYNRVGQYDEAIENYDKAIKLNPKYAFAFNNRCSAYTAKGTYDRAIEDCSRAIAIDSTKANFFVSRGNAYTKKPDYDRAMSDYDEAIRLDANNVSAYMGRCSVFIHKANYSNAIESCDQALKRQPDNSSARNNRCWAYATLGPEEQLKQALVDCDEALRLRPNDPYAFDSRGFVYLKMGNFEKAIADYDQSILLGGERPGSLYGRGIAKLKKGDAEGGNKDIMVATKKNPDVAEEFRGYGVQQ